MAGDDKLEFYRGQDVSLYSTDLFKNSTSTPPASGGLYTGEWVETHGFTSITVSCLTDQAATGSIEFSTNKINVDAVVPLTISAATTFSQTHKLTRKFVRVKLQNTSGTDQTALRLQTILGYVDVLPLRRQPDGSMAVPVYFETPLTVTLDEPGEMVSQYNGISAVASGATATIVSYTVPAGQTLYLQHVEYSGENIADYTLEIDGTVEAKRRTCFPGPFDGEMKFVQTKNVTNLGLTVGAGIIIALKVLNFRPEVADFDGRIVGVLV